MGLMHQWLLKLFAGRRRLSIIPLTRTILAALQFQLRAQKTTITRTQYRISLLTGQPEFWLSIRVIFFGACTQGLALLC